MDTWEGARLEAYPPSHALPACVHLLAHAPPTSPSTHSCLQAYGKCDSPWMLAGNYCAATCGRCAQAAAAPTQPAAESPAPAPASYGAASAPAALAAKCTDVAPPELGCGEQKAYGKCNSEWMVAAGYCMATCGRCALIGPPSEALAAGK